MESNDDDLYGDLDVTLDKTAVEKKRKSGSIDSRNQNRRYYSPTNNGDEESSASGKTKKENESSRERIRILEEENIRLRRNIGTLFRTAKNEIQRKDDQIDRLQQQQQQKQKR